MHFRSLRLTSLITLTAILAVSPADATDWKTTPRPAPAAPAASSDFKEPVALPEFEADADDLAPTLVLPAPEAEPDEASTSPFATSEKPDQNPTQLPALDLEPPFETDPDQTDSGEAALNSSASDSDGQTAKNSSERLSPESGLQLKELEGREESDLPLTDWFGRWNESSFDWVLPGGSDGIGFFSITGDTPAWNFDLDAEEEGLQIDFGTAIHFVDGPGHPGSDLPPRLFDIFWNARFVAETDSGFGIDANFKPGLFTDFEDSVREGWRFPGRVLAYADLWSNSGTGRIVGGIEYLDLEQTEILPAGGIIFEPNPDVHIDLYFPRPQLRLRIDQKEENDQWLYFRGEYHSSAWAIERTTGNADLVSLTEYRATVGLETIPHDREESSSFLEVSLLFNRDLEYRSGLGNFQPEDTVMIRLGSRY